MSQFDGRAPTAEMEYGKYGSFDLPSVILLTLDVPSMDTGE